MEDSALRQLDADIKKLEGEIRNDLAELPPFVRFLMYWYFRLIEGESKEELEELFGE